MFLLLLDSNESLSQQLMSEKNYKVDEGVETALAVTDDLFLIEGMEVRLSEM